MHGLGFREPIGREAMGARENVSPTARSVERRSFVACSAGQPLVVCGSTAGLHRCQIDIVSPRLLADLRRHSGPGRDRVYRLEPLSRGVYRVRPCFGGHAALNLPGPWRCTGDRLLSRGQAGEHGR